MVDAFGAITWWGFSPALDLQDVCSSLSSKLENLKVNEAAVSQDPLNVLLIGAGDCRHILKTLAQAKRWPKRMINIYVVENNLEVLARHLLLLSIALEPKERLGLQEKTELFLELFGNSLIRPQSSEYLQQRSNEFIRMVTDFDYLEANLPNINMSQLKFKERDFLEGIFKFWRNPDPKLFDICKVWEARIRQYLGVRYDSRHNIYDWDITMKLQKKAPIIHVHEYKGWREHGVAFELRQDSTYEVSNRTLASGILLKKAGERVPCRGYWGDILNSPYLSFGTESEEKSLFKVNNAQHVKMAKDVSEFNITAMMHELSTGERYKPPNEADEKKPNTGISQKATIHEIIEEEEDEEQKESEQPSEKSSQEKNDYMNIDGVQIYFLPLNCVPDLPKKSKYSKLFNLIYFSNSMVHLLNQDVNAIFADEAVVITETTKFMLDLKAEQMQEYMKKITSIAHTTGCKATRSHDGEKDSHAVFLFKRSTTD